MLSLGSCDLVPQQVQMSGGPSLLPFLGMPQFYCCLAGRLMLVSRVFINTSSKASSSGKAC